MADPAAAVIDDFNRAGPGLGANWSTFSGAGTPLAIASSTLLGRGGGSYTGSYYNVTSISRPVEAFIDIVSGVEQSTRYFGVQLLTSPNDTTANDDGYYVGTSTSDNPEQINLYRVDDGSETEIGELVDDNMNGSKVAIQLDATHARIWSNNGTWVEQDNVADATYSGAFFVTIDIFDPDDLVRLDNLAFAAIGGGGTDYDADPNAAAATASGPTPGVTTLTRPYVLTTIS